VDKKKRLLICGDSFVADWSKKNKDKIGWVNMLNDYFDVTNIAQAGVSEYKIYLQIKKIKLSNYDYVLISHTSAYRIPIVHHPIHKNDILHNECDLIYSDVKEHSDNHLMNVAKEFYEHLFNVDYFVFIHKLIRNEIKKLVPNAINITFFDSFNNDCLKLEKIFLKNKGDINHLNSKGNKEVLKKLLLKINKIKNEN
jgi:hypothetical protein